MCMYIHSYIAKTEVVAIYGYLLILFPSLLHLVRLIKLNLLGYFLLRILKEWLLLVISRVNNRLERVSNFTIPSEK